MTYSDAMSTLSTLPSIARIGIQKESTNLGWHRYASHIGRSEITPEIALKSDESESTSLCDKSDEGVMSISTWMPTLPARNDNSGETLHAIGRPPDHLILFSSISSERMRESATASTLTITESSGSMSMTGRSSRCRTANISVKSEDDDCTIIKPVRSKAIGSYRFSGPSGMGSIRGSKDP